MITWELIKNLLIVVALGLTLALPFYLSLEIQARKYYKNQED
jgi:hypothetical protein